MRLNYWLRSLFEVPPRRRTRTAAAAVEALEDRTLLTTFTVNTTADTVDVDPGDGVAEDSNGETSLRAAVMEADGLAGQEVEIVLPGGTYVLGGALHFNAGANVSLVGESAATSIIDGGGVDRILNNFHNSSVVIRDVTLRNGRAIEHGGGILNRGDLSVHRTTITDNETSDGFGGAIYNQAVLRVMDSSLHGNSATNCCGFVGHAVMGRGISSVTHIENSTISGNNGVGSHPNSNAVAVEDGILELVGSTIANNGKYGIGYGDESFLSLTNTIVVGHDIDFFGSSGRPPFSGGGNLIGVTRAGLLPLFSPQDLVGLAESPINAHLGPLQDNGGPTQTHALLAGSPAIDAGRSYGARTTDQRGIARPQDGNGDGTAAVDIGAYEWIENAPPTLDEIAAPEPINESSGQQTISLAGITGGIGESQAVQVTAASSNQAVILDPVVSYTSPDSTGTLTYTPAGLGVSEVTVTVTDGGTDDDLGTTPDNATVTRTFTVDVRDSGILYVDSDDWSDDGLTVLLDGANVRVVVTGTDTDAVSPTALAGITAIDVSGRPDADDLLTVDYTGGNPAPSGGITFDGDTGSDALALENGSVTTTGYVFTDASSGTIEVDGGVITYTNLEQITDNLSAVDRVFTFGPGSDQVTLVDISGISRLSSVSSSETVDFIAPTGSLTINTSAGNDTVDTSGSNLAVTLNGGAGFDWLTGGPSADRLLGGGRNDTLDGGAGNDTISGQAGFDWLYGADGDDSLDGGDGDDTIDGEAGDDIITGGEGFDRLLGDVGNDQIDGGTEDDRISGGDGDDTLDGGDGDDFLNGQLGNDTVGGGIGNDRVFGGGGDDELDGGDGDDRIRGNGGNDILTAGLGTNRLDGGSGTDRLTETAIRTNEALFLFASMFRRSMTGGKTYDSPWTAIEEWHFIGNEGDNVLDAYDFTDEVTLDGGAGDDFLRGSNQDDILKGGDGNDSLIGGAGADTLDGGIGNDSITGGEGMDSLDGNDGDDSLFGGSGIDSLNGNDGNDVLGGEQGGDILDGGNGIDLVWQAADSDQVLTDTLLTGEGDDTLSNIEGGQLTGGLSNNVLDASSFSVGPVTLNGSAGDDTLFGSRGSDHIAGGDGSDLVSQTADGEQVLTDSLLTGDGDDTLSNIERAMLFGENGHDRLDASEFTGNSTLSGLDGHDILIGSMDKAHFDGGPGTDRASVIVSGSLWITNTTFGVSSFESLTILADAGNNLIDASAFSIGPLTLYGGAGDDTLVGSHHGDVLHGGAGDDSLVGGGGDDRLAGGYGVDTILGGSGEDQVTANNDSVDAGDGDDEIQINVHGNENVLRGGEGHDTLRVYYLNAASLTNETLTRGVGSQDQPANIIDVVTEFEKVIIIGDHLANRLDASLFTYGSVRLYGGESDDTLVGSGNDDLLSGEAGQDVLDGGPGTDTAVEWVRQDTGNRITLTNTAIESDVPDSLVSMERGFMATFYGSGVNVRLDASAFTLGPVTLVGACGKDTLLGGHGDDVIDDAASSLACHDNDYISGGPGDDTLTAHEGADTIYGGHGNDVVYGGDGNDGISGGEGDDTLHGEGGADTIHGGDGQDLIYGQSEDDYLKGGPGHDYIDAGSGNDTINGGDGNDTIKGGTGNDGLSGADGTDWLYGSSGNDTLIGRAGNDKLYGNAGDDIALGGDGDDRINCATGTDTVAGNAGTDVIKDDPSEIDESFSFYADWVNDD